MSEGMFAEATQALAGDLREARDGDAAISGAVEAIHEDDARPDFDGALTDAGVLTQPDDGHAYETPAGDDLGWSGEPEQDGAIDWHEEAHAAAIGHPESLFWQLDDDSQIAVLEALQNGDDPNELFDFTDDDDARQGLVAAFDGDAERARQHFEDTSEYLAELAQEEGPEAVDAMVDLIDRVGPAMYEQVGDDIAEIEADLESDGATEDDIDEFVHVYARAALESGNRDGAWAVLNQYIGMRNQAVEADVRQNPHQLLERGYADRTDNGVIGHDTAKRAIAGDPSALLKAEIAGFTHAHAELARQKRAVTL